jgi:large subunit ribosomal protein L24
MRIKKGDNVKVISGKDKGKSGKVIQVFPKLNKLVVEGVNIAYKHIRTRKQGEKGQKLEFAAPFSASNVLLICPKCGKPTRFGTKTLQLEGAKSRKIRVCRKCQEAIE